MRTAAVSAGLGAGWVREQGARVRTVRVEVPVLVPCKTMSVAAPPWAAQGLKKSDSLELKVRALLSAGSG